LAGIAASESLLSRGHEVTVVHNSALPTSTGIATGMYNPVVFRRLNLSWMIHDILEPMHDFYKKLEKRWGIALQQEIEFVKRIPSTDYAQLWEKRRLEPLHDQFMGPIQDGYGPVYQAGIIDCETLQLSYVHEMKKGGRLIDEAFDHDAITFHEQETKYKDQPYDLVLFCEGPYAVHNPFFEWLPFNLCQGEWITIETDRPLDDRVVNNKTNVIPLGGNRYKLSSTYSWKTLDWNPSEEAKEELIQNFRELYDVTFRVVDHRAAIRPTVADRRPYLGRHPQHPSLAIFNGLGSKGVMLAPYLAQHLCRHLLDGEDLMPEVDIARHAKRLRQA
jgi:glycine oxidase